MVLKPESMIAAGLELINLIDPTLTWNTVSKGRRSRRPFSKFLKSDKDQGKKNLKRSSGTDSDKSDLSVQEQGFGNMEHMPIKKRRFFLRSSSPTPQSPNREGSQELDSGPCTLDQQTCSNENTEQDVSGTCFSKPALKKCGMNGVAENTASSFSEVLVSSEDFSSMEILAAVAACSHELDCAVGHIEKSKMGDLLKKKFDKSFASTTDMKENIAVSGSSDCLGMTTGQIMEDECMADFPNSIQNDRLKNLTKISELSRVETNESVLSAINQEESIECCGSPSDLTNKDIKIADEAAKISGAPKNYRLHWDLNKLMDEWDHPIDDTCDGSSMGSMAVASSVMSFQKPKNEDVSMSMSPERPIVIESGDHSNAQSVTCSMPYGKILPDCGRMTSVISASNKSDCSLRESSDLITGIFKGNCSFHGTPIETTSNGVVELIQQNTSAADVDSNFDHSLFLGMKGADNNLISSKINDTSATKLIKVAEGGSQLTLQTKVPENELSLVAPSENASGDGKVVHSGHFDSKERSDLDENRKGSGIICRPVSTNSELLEYKNSVDANENKSLDALSLSAKSSFEVPMIELKDSDGSHCLSTLEVSVAPLATIGNNQAMNMVIAKEIEENSSTPDASGCEHRMEVVPNVTEALLQENPTSNNANVANVEQGYDSYLEDGELRESVQHCWEHNEGEDAEIEHVDYGSDDNEGIFFEAVNDDVQLSGEVLSGECGKQNYHLGKDEPNLDNSLDENCSLQNLNCLSSVDSKVSENLKLEDRVEGDSKDSGRSDLETDRSGNEYDHDTLRNCRGASSSERELQFSDKSANSISSNTNNMQQVDCSGESEARRQAPLTQADRFVDRSRNVELKSVITDSLAGGGERIARVSEDNTPTSIGGPRIISTSQSVYNPMRRGSPGGSCGPCGVGTVKGGDFTLDSNPSNKLDRCFNGMNRGFREGYSRPGAYEGGKTNGSMLNHFENTTDSHFHQSPTKFRSKSTTRSPDFRCNTRMGQARSPYQPPSHIRERRSPVKSFNQSQRFDTMGSPGRLRSDDCIQPMMRPARFNNTTSSRDPDCEVNYHYQKKPFAMHGNERSRSRSRSYSPNFRPDSRMSAVRDPYQPRGGHFRERKSPVRALRPGQRYDNGDQPSMRTGRFNDTSHPNRGNGYNNGGDEYRRKPRNIFERIHPGRQYDQYDEQANRGGRNFRGNGNYVRGGGRGGGHGGRCGDRRQGEESANLRYNNNNNNSDRMFYSGPRQFEGGMRDYAEDTLPSGVRS